MQTQQLWFLDFMGQPRTQFTIPVYQRVYSWYEDQCEELTEDILRCGGDEVSHFMSMTLYRPAETTGDLRKLDIIDGQQRIATATIALTALRDYIREKGIVLRGTALENQTDDFEGAGITDDFDADALHERFLTVRDGEAAAAKIQLIGPDGTTLSALILGTAAPEHESTRVRENYEYFLRRMHEEGFDAQRFWDGVRELLVVAAELDEEDEAQTIFEGLNTKGIPLTAADLMRNYLLVGETRREQQRLYQEYWQPMEIMFVDDQNSSGSLKLNTGLRMWLAIRFKRMCIADRTRTYHYFKIYMETEYDGTVEELLDEVRGFSYLWSKNYESNGGRIHCSRYAWAKNGRQTLVPPMERASDVMSRVRKSREQMLMEQMENGRAHKEAKAAATRECPTPTFEKSPAGYETTTFGRWGDEPITWRVLDRDGKEALLLAERILDCMPYHSSYVSTTWAECFLRSWANEDFYENAFSGGEALRVMPTTVHTPDDELWETVGGADCEDRVWLLSKEEALRYFADSDDRMARPTDYASKQMISIERGHSLWWLRSPGHGQGFASTVWPVGGVDTAGSGVGRSGVGFRPVIRVKL